MFMWVCESTMCIYGVDARDLSHLSPPVTFHINFGDSSSLNLKLVGWLGCLLINLQESTCPTSRGTAMPSSYVGARNLNSGS